MPRFEGIPVQQGGTKPPRFAGIPVEQQKTQPISVDAWNAASEADKLEGAFGTGLFGDITGSGIAKAVPFADEIVSGATAPFRAAREWVEGEGFDIPRAYDRNMQVEEELQNRREERSPIGSVAGAVAGGLGAAGPLMQGGATFLQGAKATLPSLMGRGAAEGAAYGAAYGAGEGRGMAERSHNALFGAGTGAAVGTAGGAVARIGAGRAAKEATPSLDNLRRVGDQAYKRADEAGVAFTPNAVARLKTGIEGKLVELGYDPALHPGANAVVKRIEGLVGQNVTLKGLDSLRRVASNGFQPGNKANNKAVNEIIDSIDDLIANPSAQDVLMGDAQAGAKALQQARTVWSRLSKAERLSGAIERAELRAASTGSGGNADNAIRQNARRLLESGRGWSKEEKAALQAIVKGTPAQNALRLLGKLSPSGNGLMAALGIGGTMVNPLVGLASLGGLGAKAAADAMTKGNVAALDAIIRSGGRKAPALLSGPRSAITQGLIHGSAPQLPDYMPR